jgi:glutaminase
MKQGLWLVVTAALAVGALISVVDLEARQTVSPQVHEGDSALMAADMKRLQRDAREVAATLAGNKEGNVYSAAVPGTDPGHLALAVALVDGRIFSVGEADVRFPLMSISKPFTYALALEQHGVDFMIDHIGVSATGFSYNAVAAGAVRRTSEQNPLVNAGAIATHGYIDGATPADKINAVVGLYSRMANRPLSIEETWHVTPRALTYTLAYQMKASGRLEGDVEDIIERYLESNIVAVTVEDLARMGATLAAGGIAADWRTYPEIRDRAHGPVGDGHCWHVRRQRPVVDTCRAAGQEWRQWCDPGRGTGLGCDRRLLAATG